MFIARGFPHVLEVYVYGSCGFVRGKSRIGILMQRHLSLLIRPNSPIIKTTAILEKSLDGRYDVKLEYCYVHDIDPYIEVHGCGMQSSN